MNFAKRVFFWAGIYGLVVVTPQFFLENRVGIDTSPAITHPEYFYGFAGVAFAFQILFLILSRDPVRYRPMMIPSMIEKFGFVIACYALFFLGRAPGILLIPASGDLILGILFIIAYLKTPA